MVLLLAMQLMVLVGLILSSTGVQTASYSARMDWLRSDGILDFFSLFDEGDTAICRCIITIDHGPQFSTAEFQWKQYGHGEKTTIAQGEQITMNIDSRNRFSEANLTIVDENTTDYRITISNIDRYDSGLRFFCSVAWPRAVGHVATELKVRWGRPITQCSSDVTEKAKKGTDVSYRCSAVDTDGRSSNMGSITMWKNNDTKLQATTTDTELQIGSLYNASYTTQITDGSVKDVYTCRYHGTGGFEEYNTNCTFNKPTCVVDDLDDVCMPSNKGVLMSCDHFNIAINLSILIIYWITM